MLLGISTSHARVAIGAKLRYLKLLSYQGKGWRCVMQAHYVIFILNEEHAELNLTVITDRFEAFGCGGVLPRFWDAPGCMGAVRRGTYLFLFVYVILNISVTQVSINKPSWCQ